MMQATRRDERRVAGVNPIINADKFAGVVGAARGLSCRIKDLRQFFCPLQCAFEANDMACAAVKDPTGGVEAGLG